MWLNRKGFAKLLQDSEAHIFWSSDTLPSCALVHVWTHTETGEVILREYQTDSGQVAFWACEDHFKG